MKTITKCFLCLAIMCPLGLADFYFALYGIAEGNWIVASLNIIAIVLLVFAIRSAYKTAKGYEEILANAVHDLQLRSDIRDLKDILAKDFVIEKIRPKGKEDEVATDK